MDSNAPAQLEKAQAEAQEPNVDTNELRKSTRERNVTWKLQEG